MPQLSSNLIEIDGVALHYWTNGAAGKPAMLLLHGWLGNHKGLVEVAKYLDDYNVIIPDLPGFGASATLGGNKYGLPDYTDFLAKFVEKLNLGKLIIVGHSYGGCLALTLAANYPDLCTKLVMFTPAITSRNKVANFGYWYYRFAAFLPPAARQRWIKNKPLVVISNRTQLKVSSRLQRQVINHNDIEQLYSSNVDLVINIFLDFIKTDFYNTGQMVKCPSLLVAGGKDWAVSPEAAAEFAATLPNCTFELLPKSAHLVVIDEPKLTAATLVGWLNAQ